MSENSRTGTYGENMAGCMLWIPKFGSLIFIGIFGRLGTIYSDLKNKEVEYLSVEMGIVDDIDKKIQELISAIEKQKASTCSNSPSNIATAVIPELKINEKQDLHTGASEWYEDTGRFDF